MLKAQNIFYWLTAEVLDHQQASAIVMNAAIDIGPLVYTTYLNHGSMTDGFGVVLILLKSDLSHSSSLIWIFSTKVCSVSVISIPAGDSSMSSSQEPTTLKWQHFKNAENNVQVTGRVKWTVPLIVQDLDTLSSPARQVSVISNDLLVVMVKASFRKSFDPW